MKQFLKLIVQLSAVVSIVMFALYISQGSHTESGTVLAKSLTAPQAGDMIYRAQIWIKTCHRENSGTDDSVGVSLNSRNNTWLNYSHDDFERNREFTYDLMVERARFVQDITQIRIHKTGSNGLALRSFALIVNGQALYSRDFGSSCHWLDNEDGHRRAYIVTSSQIRNQSLWRNYRSVPPPTLFTRAEIESRIEGIAGNALRAFDIPAKWGGISGRAVEVKRKDAQTLSVDLDFEKRGGITDGLDVDVDFDLKLGCSNGRMTIKSTRPKISTSFDFIYKVDNVPPISVDLNIGGAGCPIIRVTNNGDVRLQYPTPTPRPTKRPTRTPTPRPTATADKPATRQISFQAGRLPNANYDGVIDTTLMEDTPQQNYGFLDECYADGDDPPGNNTDMVALLKWDVSAIPTNSQVTAAWVTLAVTNRSNDTYWAYGLRRSWRESEATWRQPRTGQEWVQAGAASDRTDRFAEQIGSIGNVDTGNRIMQLNRNGRRLVQGWIDGSIENHGIAIANPAAVDGLDFHCSQSDSVIERPALTIEYVR